MRLPLQIAFHIQPHSDEIEAKIRAEAGRLDEFHDRIMSCRVVADVPHRHHQEGNLQVRIDLKVPGDESVVKRDPAEHADDRDLDNLRFGADQARRGPLGRGDVLDARPLADDLRPLPARAIGSRP
jgi:hypothetical protein